ncbi:hypothetical protein [Enterococcus faecalis]|uniref:hypothetical protein n=1 Tax=Enterococcus TaxID=1350 RepID=UPI001AD65DC4|nr:hypothetical protein [Enterococcus faecalis]MBO6322919.1 hypothetical protein [Enterococcus faecalis]HAP3771965.1 hypothetical protein [Enterococcus faecalis]HAP3830082.1 hypothetical protein [Enterococcus faecalis]
MAGKFKWVNFSEVNLNDCFFDSLKQDYQEFPVWFQRKASEGEKALVFQDMNGIGAFIYLKEEEEAIELKGSTRPSIKRIKIGTLKLSEEYRNQRLGEGAIGVALWKWQESRAQEIYVTVFKKHDVLVKLLESFGFVNIGENSRGELVYLKNRNNINYSTPKMSFPFVNPYFYKAGLLPIIDQYHDKLLPYSELKGNHNEIEEITAGNGVTKVFIASPYTPIEYSINSPLFIYRIHNGEQKTYKSVVTSFGMVSNVKEIKRNKVSYETLEVFLKLVGNKTVFSESELVNLYNTKPNLVVLEFLYNGYFGKGNNINHYTLQKNNLFNTYPYKVQYTLDEFKYILNLGKVDVSNVII